MRTKTETKRSLFVALAEFSALLGASGLALALIG